MRVGLTILIVLLSLSARTAEPMIDCVEVKTRAPNNPLVKVWYRVPRAYDPQDRMRSRVLVLFGGRNADGRLEVSGKLGWTTWADQNGIFLVAPTLRDDAYWEPKAWSGRALQDALSEIASKYRIATSGLLYYGYSAGSQASNLFPAWRPDFCRAYVSHACGVFHEPTAKMRDVAGLVTCGDADTARYVLSRQFVARYRTLGVPIVWKSFPNHPHDVPPGSIALAQAFLAHAHWTHPEDLGGERVAYAGARFVGDDADGVYYRTDSAKALDIMPEDRIELPSATVAAAWGVEGEFQDRAAMGFRTEDVNGVEVVSLVPERVREDSRILVLLGGRNWTGRRAIDSLGFRDWTVERRWCILAPSFRAEDYWRPESGSRDVIVKSLDRLRKRHGLRPLPVFMFGYSAGGQLTTLLQDVEPKLCAAWAVYGCGVYPEIPQVQAPGFIACGLGDEERLRISRDFVYRCREAGGLLLWKPMKAGHELNGHAVEMAKLFFEEVAKGRSCGVWGEDDTFRTAPRERIEVEFCNPLFGKELAALWRKK